jgi:hypothetical protein
LGALSVLCIAFNLAVPNPDTQMQLFVLLAAQSASRQRRDLAAARSRGRREVALAIGQIGNQLALALWRGEELARVVRSSELCPACTDVLGPALEQFNDGPKGRHAPPSRILPVLSGAW